MFIRAFSRSALTLSIFALCLAFGFTTASAQPTQVAPGVTYELRVLPGPRRAHITRVDLCTPGVKMRATAPGEGPRTTSSFGSLVGAAAAINGDWWGRDGNPRLPDTIPRGLALGNRTHFTQTADPAFYGFMAFGFNRAVASNQPEAVGQPQPWMHEVVSGQPTIIADGMELSTTGGHCARNPRTITGLSQDKKTFYMVVVDGRNNGVSIGMTCNESATFMKSLGAHDALIQDGGGSSAMWVNGSGVVNRPSDGNQRSVVNHWAVIASGSGPPHACVTRNIPTPSNGIRRAITGPGFANWGFDFADVIPVDDAYLNRFPRGSNLPDNFEVVKADTPSIYVAVGNMKRGVRNPPSMLAWRFTNGWQTRTQAQLNSLFTGPPMLQTPVLVKGSGATVWLLDVAEPVCADVEACNGQDDDCDVKIDEGCVANVPDASVPDGSIPDSSLPDAPTPMDASFDSNEQPDASRFLPDVPILDASDNRDTSRLPDTGDETDPTSGCGCHVSQQTTPANMLPLFGLAATFLIRRRGR